MAPQNGWSIKSHVGKSSLLSRRCGLLREKAPHDARSQRLEAVGVMFIDENGTAVASEFGIAVLTPAGILRRL